MVDIKKLTVSTDEQREQWIELLRRGAQYHMDMAEAYKPEIIGAEDDVYRIHMAWSNAISDAISLIEMWQVEEDDVELIIDVEEGRAKNITEEADALPQHKQGPAG
jgi:hypothetical protein